MIRRRRLPMIGPILWCRLLRYLTRNRHVPLDAETRAELGTWAWLTGQDMAEYRRNPRGGEPA